MRCAARRGYLGPGGAALGHIVATRRELCLAKDWAWPVTAGTGGTENRSMVERMDPRASRYHARSSVLPRMQRISGLAYNERSVPERGAWIPRLNEAGMASTRFAPLRRPLTGLRRTRRAAARGDVKGQTLRMPPTGLVLLSIGSVQLGAALSKQLFPAIGSSGAVLLRVGFAAIVLGLLWRPRVWRFSRTELGLVALYGLALAGMNATFYAAIARLPLGVAVTLEFVGPLGVAFAGSRKLLDLAWVVLAGAGVVLLAPLTGAALDPLGVALALIAGGFWAGYILIGTRVGRAISGGTGLAQAMAVAALVLLPVGVVGAGTRLLDARILLIGLGVAMLSSVIPFSLELEAMRRLPTRVFGILLSLDPAIAALVGLLVLHEAVGPRELAAMALIIAASVGATFESRA